MHTMTKGDLIGIEGAIIHNLKATENSIIRLSIHKKDHMERVQNVLNTN
ncbi:hypothetical protein FM120_15975 [Sphingobacterium faecium PCAi_F2.5]|nr:hypothetical protein FM120_15975 [Sphingobacterium faecium PCAi_F2.5]